jgi:hypothetical protein
MSSELASTAQVILRGRATGTWIWRPIHELRGGSANAPSAFDAYGVVEVASV